MFRLRSIFLDQIVTILDSDENSLTQMEHREWQPATSALFRR
jgi:hypothetical protein